MIINELFDRKSLLVKYEFSGQTFTSLPFTYESFKGDYDIKGDFGSTHIIKINADESLTNILF